MQNKHQEAEAEIAKLYSEIGTLKLASNSTNERNKEDESTLAELQHLHDYQITINDQLNEQIEELENKIQQE